jgi:hypothetical protein
MLKPLIEMVFGCQHSHTTFPMTPRREGPLHRFRRKEMPAITCLDCGAEFDYDWRHMKVGKRRYPPIHQHPDVRPTLDAERAS